MFIELKTKTSYTDENWKRTIIRSESIIEIIEPPRGGNGGPTPPKDTGSMISKSNGETSWCKQSVDEVLHLLQSLENKPSSSYSVTLEGSGFSNTISSQ